ncbi:cupin domain-containing protein [Pseudomonas sp. S3_E10]
MQELISELARSSNKPLSPVQLLKLASNEYFCPQELLSTINKQWRDKKSSGHTHQLGFFKFQIAVINGNFPRTVRLHYWNRTKIKDDIHDHISSFASKVIYGSLKNEFYEPNDESKNYILKKFKSVGSCCTPSRHELEKMQSLEFLREETLEAGQSYFLKYDQLHRLVPKSDELVTLIIQDIPIDREINVYRHANDVTYRSESAIPISDFNFHDIFSRLENLIG